MATQVTHVAILAVLTLIVCLALVRVFDKPFFHWLPASSIFLLVGVAVGGIIRAASDNDDQPFVTFDPDIFFNFLLPPIIFHAGLSLMKKDFFRNLSTIMILAVIGTVFSVLVVFGCMRLFATQFSALPAGMFAVLISAVDPVAVLSLFEKYHSNCDRTVYALIFGESLLNDAVCVVLFDALSKAGHGSVGKSIGQFIYLGLVSPLLGVVFGMVVSLIFKHSNLREHTTVEVAVAALVGAYLPYLAAEEAGLSAIVTIFVAGIMTNHYTLHNLSAKAQEGLMVFSGTLAVISETLVFLYMGVGVLASHKLKWDLWLIVKIIFACMVARAANSFILLPLCNLGRRVPVARAQMGAIWFAGLRGAIAFALATKLAKQYDDTRYLTNTIGVVMFTTFILGGVCDKLYRMLGMIGITRARAASETGQDGHVRGGVHKKWHNIDAKFLKPFLCVDGHEEERRASGHFLSQSQLIRSTLIASDFGGDSQQPSSAPSPAL